MVFMLAPALWDAPSSVAAENPITAYAWRDVSAHIDFTAHAWSATTTATVAPFGTLNYDGPRLRATGGYGRYDYTGLRNISGTALPTRFRGVQSYSEVMLGYQLQFGRATVKGFAGASGISHIVAPFDPHNNTVSGLDIGFKAALEAWFEISDRIWASADLSWTAAHQTYATRLRAGWRIIPNLSIGPEGGVLGNATYDGVRAGAFARYSQDWGEISLSAGITGDIEKPNAPYVTLNWLIRY